MGLKNSKQVYISAKHQYDVAYNTLVDKITKLILYHSKEGHNVCIVKFTNEFLNYNIVLDHFRNLGYKMIQVEDNEFKSLAKKEEEKKIVYKIYWGCDDDEFNKLNPA